MSDSTPIAYLARDDRYVEKLATPDVTVADLVGDLDPIKAARGGEDLSSELTMHYGLLPRANRGIFAINELPDLAGKIQVALFNIMQEGDVQIKGYPVRLALDVALVFSANPEDYTARGKIVTPLKDRIGSEIRTHYPETIEEGITITAQEAWSERGASPIEIPPYVREVVEQIAFSAREDKKVDKRSGVSQRLPISTMELVVSNAERRALVQWRKAVRAPRSAISTPRFPASPASSNWNTRARCEARTPWCASSSAPPWARSTTAISPTPTRSRSSSGSTWAARSSWTTASPAAAAYADLKQIQGLFEKLSPLQREDFGRATRKSSPQRSSCSRACRPSQAEPQRRARIRRPREDAAQTGAHGTGNGIRRWQQQPRQVPRGGYDN